MCGITGFFAFNEEYQEKLTGKLDRSTSSLSQRGPDYGNTFTFHSVGLGHRRLSIIDISEKGNQPMSEASGRYVISYNGEVYNFMSIRHELTAKGYQFRSGTDTEVILNAYAEWGPYCLDRFNGFFAFAIYDKQDRSLFLARDRMGIKPLVYSHDKNRLIFSSEIKALSLLEDPGEIDRQAMNLYFQLTYIPAPYTIYKKFRKLFPGHFMLVRENKVTTKPYYKPPVFHPEKQFDSFEKAKTQLKNDLQTSVEQRMIADVPLGTFLSGGIDSSIISAIARDHTRDLHTFSIGYRDHPFFDETSYAELVAKKLGTHHHVFSLGNEDLLGSVQEMTSYLDEPFADSSALPMYILSKETRKKVTVALSGDGADELFSGYNKHEAWERSIRKSAINKILSIAGGLINILPKSRQNRWSNFFRQLDKYKTLLSLPLKERYWHLAAFIPEKEVVKLLAVNYYQEIDDFKSEVLEVIDSTDLNHVLELDVQMVLTGDMLRKVDAMSMSRSLEVRVPFLDHHVVETAFRIPSEFKLNKISRKHILREAYKEQLPEEIFKRGKQGFEVPLLDWFRNELKKDLDDLVFDRQKIEDQGIFQWKEIKNIRKQLHSNNPGDVPIKVWQLYVFERCMAV